MVDVVSIKFTVHCQLIELVLSERDGTGSRSSADCLCDARDAASCDPLASVSYVIRPWESPSSPSPVWYTTDYTSLLAGICHHTVSASPVRV